MSFHFGYSRDGIWDKFACSRLEGQMLGLFMRQHFTVFKRISRLDAGVASLTLPVLIAACLLSVSSAQAGVETTTWAPFTYTSTPLSISSTTIAPSDFSAATITDDGSKLTIELSPIASFGGLVNLSFICTSASGGSPVSLSSDWSWSYTINGTQNPLGPLDSGSILDLSAITSSSGPDIFITGNFGNGNISGVTFSDFTMTSLPEPINYALAGFGLIFVGGSFGRFFLGRRRFATAS